MENPTVITRDDLDEAGRSVARATSFGEPWKRRPRLWKLFHDLAQLGYGDRKLDSDNRRYQLLETRRPQAISPAIEITHLRKLRRQMENVNFIRIGRRPQACRP
jgi:hypothetical protein